jgi:hypothetical protein
VPWVERAMQEADVVIVDHWRRFRTPARLPPCFLKISEPGDGPDDPVRPYADPAPNLPIGTLNSAGSDVSCYDFDPRSNLLSAFRHLQYPFHDWGAECNSTSVSRPACLEMREEFIPREESDEEIDDEE